MRRQDPKTTVKRARRPVLPISCSTGRRCETQIVASLAPRCVGRERVRGGPPGNALPESGEPTEAIDHSAHFQFETKPRPAGPAKTSVTSPARRRSAQKGAQKSSNVTSAIRSIRPATVSGDAGVEVDYHVDIAICQVAIGSRASQRKVEAERYRIEVARSDSIVDYRRLRQTRGRRCRS